jgi:uncharacterized glyoxalase superfamily protein PhnB
MLSNRSVPVDSLLPHLCYKDLPAAIAWLAGTFGFVEHYHYGEPAQGAQMHLGNAWIMLNGPRSSRQSPADLGSITQSLTVFVEDVDAHYARTRAAGATIVEDLNETAYGERQYGALDLEGHHWLFSRHARDVSPTEWGASVINPL